jgi:Protein O-mannosyl-transferase TMEM260-like/Tetratricopeptide repeat
MKQTSPSTPVAPTAAEARTARRIFWVGAAISFLGSLALYARTMEATSPFWDSGEFIASAHILGIPHSPGTPLYVLVAKVATLLPIPLLNIAQRVNLLSAFCGAAGVLFVFALAVRFFDDMVGPSRTVGDAVTRTVGALTGAMFLAFSDTYWANSTEAEVYAMSNAFMGFMTWLALKWGDLPKTPQSTSLIYLVFYLLALSVGFHLGTVLVFSGIFFFVLMSRDRPFSTLEWLVASLCVAVFIADATMYRNGALTLVLLIGLAGLIVWLYVKRSPFTAVCSGLFVLGLSVHLMLLIRSLHNPAIDEGNPETWRNLYAVLRREQYPPMSVLKRKADFGFQLQHFNGYFQAQFQMFSSYVGRLNLGSLVPIALGIWGMVDQFAKHRKTFVMLFVTLLVTTLGLVVFLNFSDSEVRERDYFYSSGFYYFAIFLGIGAASVLREIKNGLAKSGGSVPITAAVCAAFLAFPMFTLKRHYFSHNRSHNRVCAEYARNMLACLDPNAILFTNGDNDTFPLWYIQEVEGFRKDVRVVNLSLLNTEWYIKQCRDNEPRVPIAWKDDEIDALVPRPSKDGWVLVRDQAVNHILFTNRFERPIYFAVTIPAATFAPYRDILEMQGMAYEVVARKGERMVNVEKLEQCIVHEFKYGGILTADWKRDESIYLAPHIVHLIQNYSVAFMELAYAKHQAGDFQTAIHYMEIADQISPQLGVPAQLLGLYYFDAGDTSKAISFYQDALRKSPGDGQMMFRLASIYERTGDYARALDLIDPLLLEDPDNHDLNVMAFTMAASAGMAERARGYMRGWLSRHPDDAAAQEALKHFESELEKAGKTGP